jgi:hypothetical protein
LKKISNEKEGENGKVANAVIILWLIASLIVVAAIPFVGALLNNKPSALQEINKYLESKGQKLSYSEQESDLTWSIIAFDDVKTYYYSFTQDGKTALSSYSKRSNLKPYFDFGVSPVNVSEIKYPKINITKNENVTIAFFYDPNDVEGYVNNAIVPLLRDALPNIDIREYCYGGECPRQNQTKTEVEGIFKNLNSEIKLPAIIINNETIVYGLIGIGESNIKVRYASNLKYFCQFIKGEPKCEE